MDCCLRVKMSALGSLEQSISEACLCRSFIRTTLCELCTRKEATERVGSNTSGLPDCPGLKRRMIEDLRHHSHHERFSSTGFKSAWSSSCLKLADLGSMLHLEWRIPSQMCTQQDKAALFVTLGKQMSQMLKGPALRIVACL
ncbi:hypothetical protein NDU88_004958 [Pleurodeles waltl]|uniref:Uncharacterized protein n=1 Tax=Pleurodeles waltl TaxID=8319 RepID=A0AAV7TB64_PLEWA|nr:hypothetical protein NDU88_004958 [Pleurodeles waltl]